MLLPIEVQVARVAHCWPHQQPISEMHCEGGRVLTGGQDHVLKVPTNGAVINVSLSI